MTWNDPTKAQLLCLPCIIDRKLAELAKADGNFTGPLPTPRPAVTLMGSQHGPVTPHCLEHIAVTRQSPLAVPAGMGPVR
jgi:hypothetical protein